MVYGIIRVAEYIALGLSVIGLVFRSTLYWLIPVVTGESAGLGDVIELLILYSLFGISILLIVSGLILAFFNEVKPAFIAIAVGLLSPFLYCVIHSCVPKLV